MTSVDEQVGELYGEPLDRFTSARNELAARLKKEGDKAAADEVKALRKPSVSAWVVNQLVRTRELDLKRLLAAGEKVEKAQQAMLAGKNAVFEGARKEERQAVQTLRSAANGVLPTISAQILERVTRSLEAASSSGGRDQLKKGRLTQDLEPPGFEILAGLGANHAKPKTEKTTKKSEALEERRKKAREDLKTAKAESTRLETEAKKAESTAKKATKAAGVARKKADKAAAELEKIEKELDEESGN